MARKKTIVFVNHNAGSPYHGPNLRTYYAAKYLVLRGYSVHVFSSSFSHKYVRLPEIEGLVTKENIDGVQYYWLKTLHYQNVIGRIVSFFQFGLSLSNVIEKHVPEMDAIVCSSPPPVFIRICYRIARNYEARLIFDVRDLWPLTILEMKAASKYNPYVAYMAWLENFAYSKSDAVASALPCAESYMRKHGLPLGRFYSIENGTETKDLPSVDERDLPKDIRELLISKSTFRVGYTGAFDRDNDLETFLKAADVLRETPYQFVLVGQGRERQKLKSFAERLPNVFVLSAVRSEQIPWVLERFDVCYMGLKDKPIFKYGVSMNKIFEYMRAGKPIISAINAGNDIVSEAQCGVTVRPESPQEVADAVQNFAKLPYSKLQEFGRRGAAFCEAKYSYEVLVEKWIRVIEG